MRLPKDSATQEKRGVRDVYKRQEQEQVKEEAALEREKRMQQTMLTIKKKFGKKIGRAHV